MNAGELATLAEISEAHVSKLRSGLQTWVSPEDFEKICYAISTDERDHAELLRAFLLDHATGRPGRDLVEVRIVGKRSATLQEKGPVYNTALPSAVVQAFEVLMKEAAADKDVRDHVQGLANIIARGQKRE
jgi:hypothetical protein